MVAGVPGDRRGITGRRVLIVYASRHGQTARIARYMRGVLRAEGACVTLVSTGALPRGLSPATFDGAIVGSPVHFHHHLRGVGQFVRTHVDALNAMPSAFFSVSGLAGSADQKERDSAAQLANDFLTRCGWQPSLTRPLGGILDYTPYNALLRWVMQRLARAHDEPAATSRGHELTSWEQVRTFVYDFTTILAHRRASRVA